MEDPPVEMADDEDEGDPGGQDKGDRAAEEGRVRLIIDMMGSTT